MKKTLGLSSPEYIGEDAAKAAALEHTGLTESEVTYITAKLDYDNGRLVYDIEFYCGNTEYDYEVDAYMGEIVSYDFDIEDYAITSPAAIQNSDGTYIGMAVYQIEFVSGGMEYEFEINAASGVIVEYDAESQYD